jgi:hypothetical protein
VALNFPGSPAVGDTFGAYRWNGAVWSTPGLTTLDGVLRYDTAQALTVAQQGQALTNAAAAPFDAMGYGGLQTNGGCEISQERGSTAWSANNYGGYAIDGWGIQSSGTAQVVSVQQVAGGAPPGFVYSLKFQITTASPSPAAGDYVFFNHRIEGIRWTRLAYGTGAAQPVSIAFLVRAHRPGQYSGSLRNSDGTRSYVWPVTINAADTWEYKAYTIPGCTDGTWKTDSNFSADFSIIMMTGSGFTTAGNVWTAANMLGATGQINGAAATTDTMQVTGLLILPGSELPTAANSSRCIRPADREMLLCQRYLQFSRKREPGFLLYGLGSTSAGIVVNRTSTVPLRTLPTVSAASSFQFTVDYDSSYTFNVTGVATNGHFDWNGGDIKIDGTTTATVYSGFANFSPIELTAASVIKYDSRM